MSRFQSPSGSVDVSGRRGVIVRSVDGVCTWCGVIVSAPRKTWCSDECVSAYKMTQPEVQRSVVFKRDRGMCVECGVDTAKLERIAVRIHRMVGWGHAGGAGVSAWGFRRVWDARDRGDLGRCSVETARFLAALARSLWGRTGRAPPPEHRALLSLWDLDHVTPIADGGKPHDPANWQTLCIWCHQATSARETTERARRKRAQRQASDQ